MIHPKFNPIHRFVFSTCQYICNVGDLSKRDFVNDIAITFKIDGRSKAYYAASVDSLKIAEIDQVAFMTGETVNVTLKFKFQKRHYIVDCVLENCLWTDNACDKPTGKYLGFDKKPNVGDNCYPEILAEHAFKLAIGDTTITHVVNSNNGSQYIRPLFVYSVRDCKAVESTEENITLRANIYGPSSKAITMLTNRVPSTITNVTNKETLDLKVFVDKTLPNSASFEVEHSTLDDNAETSDSNDIAILNAEDGEIINGSVACHYYIQVGTKGEKAEFRLLQRCVIDKYQVSPDVYLKYLFYFSFIERCSVDSGTLGREIFQEILRSGVSHDVKGGILSVTVQVNDIDSGNSKLDKLIQQYGHMWCKNELSRLGASKDYVFISFTDGVVGRMIGGGSYSCFAMSMLNLCGLRAGGSISVMLDMLFSLCDDKSLSLTEKGYLKGNTSSWPSDGNGYLRHPCVVNFFNRYNNHLVMYRKNYTQIKDMTPYRLYLVGLDTNPKIVSKEPEHWVLGYSDGKKLKMFYDPMLRQDQFSDLTLAYEQSATTDRLIVDFKFEELQ